MKHDHAHGTSGDGEKCETCCSGCCRCIHHKVPGILVALFGLSFLLKNFGLYGDDVQNWIWPALIFVGGIAKVGGRMCGCCSSCTCSKKD